LLITDDYVIRAASIQARVVNTYTSCGHCRLKAKRLGSIQHSREVFCWHNL